MGRGSRTLGLWGGGTNDCLRLLVLATLPIDCRRPVAVAVDLAGLAGTTFSLPPTRGIIDLRCRGAPAVGGLMALFGGAAIDCLRFGLRGCTGAGAVGKGALLSWGMGPSVCRRRLDPAFGVCIFEGR